MTGVFFGKTTCLSIFLFGLALVLFPGYAKAQQEVSFHAFADAYDREDYEQISKLVSMGFDVNSRNSDGRTALVYVAANVGKEVFAVKVADFLIANGVDVNSEDSFGRTAVVYSIEEDRQGLMRYLLDHGADTCCQCSAYRTPIVFVPFIRQKSDMVQVVIRGCRDVNIRDSLGNTALSWASRLGYVDVVKQLLEDGAVVNNKSIHNKTPLMEAAEEGHYEVAELLIKAGGDLNIQTKKGWSALMWASEKGFTDIVSMLIKAGADLFAVNAKGERALVIARKNNHPETAKVIETAEFRVRLKRIATFGTLAVLLTILTIVVTRKIRKR